MEELRCDNGILFGILVEPGIVEVKCRSHKCGAGPEVVVLHRFNTLTGEHTTHKFAEPKKGVSGGAHNHPASVRAS